LLSHAQARLASEAFFTNGFVLHQQSGPKSALARHGELTPCFDGNLCSLPILSETPLQARYGEPSRHDLVAARLATP